MTFLTKGFKIIIALLRCVAQFGRALRSGRRGRKFESCRIDSLAGAALNALCGVWGFFKKTRENVVNF